MTFYGKFIELYLTGMRKHLFPALIILIGCGDVKNDSAKTDITVNETSIESPVIKTLFTEPQFSFDYTKQKQRCQELYAITKKERTPSSEKKFISFLMDSLVACWYGTPWDYNGITEAPGEGQIACGYYVTTTLRDAGMKINRVKLAQCVSQNLLWDLCKDFKKYSDKSLEYFVNDIEKTGYGLYIVGLDNHTGYIYHDGKDVWFIHSGVYPPKCALKEKAINSITLKNSRYRVFGRIVFDK